MSDPIARRRTRGAKQLNVNPSNDALSVAGPSATRGRGVSRAGRGRGNRRTRPPEYGAAAQSPAKNDQGIEPMAKCVRRLLDSGAATLAELSQEDMKTLKQRCRTSDADLSEAHSTLFGTLGLRRTASSRPRLAALLLIDYLFIRSELARSLTFPLLNELAIATIGPKGCNVNRVAAHVVLPPPKSVADTLRETTIKIVFGWNQKFGASEPLLATFLDRLQSTYSIDFSPFRAQLAAERAAQQATVESRAAARQSALDQADNLDPSLSDFLAQFTAMLNIAAPTVDEMLAADMNDGRPIASAARSSSPVPQTYAEMSAAFGLGSTTYRLEINLHGLRSASAADPCGEGQVAPALLAEVDRAYRRAVIHVLPKLDSCLTALEATLVHFSSDALVRSAIGRVVACKEQVHGLVQRAEALGCSVLADVREEEGGVAGSMFEARAGDEQIEAEDEEEDDLDFEDVPIPDLNESLVHSVSASQLSASGDHSGSDDSSDLERELFGSP